MLIVIYAKCHKIGLYIKYHYTEWHYAECLYAECCGAPSKCIPNKIILVTKTLAYYNVTSIKRQLIMHLF
jgi:hypothetical protein